MTENENNMRKLTGTHVPAGIMMPAIKQRFPPFPLTNDQEEWAKIWKNYKRQCIMDKLEDMKNKPFKVVSLEIEDVKLIEPMVYNDDRGFFQQSYHKKQYEDIGINVNFVQDNWSRSERGVLRGLHFQRNNPQDKLVHVIRGEVFDVAVDIRKGSPTFGKWVGATLNDKNHHQLFIPKGFAHGFCVLSDEADFVYKCSDFYTPGDEYSIHWDDSDINIEWPNHIEFVLSNKDASAPYLKNYCI